MKRLPDAETAAIGAPTLISRAAGSAGPLSQIAPDLEPAISVPSGANATESTPRRVWPSPRRVKTKSRLSVSTTPIVVPCAAAATIGVGTENDSSGAPLVRDQPGGSARDRQDTRAGEARVDGTAPPVDRLELSPPRTSSRAAPCRRSRR